MKSEFKVSIPSPKAGGKNKPAMSFGRAKDSSASPVTPIAQSPGIRNNPIGSLKLGNKGPITNKYGK